MKHPTVTIRSVYRTPRLLDLTTCMLNRFLFPFYFSYNASIIHQTVEKGIAVDNR